MPALAPFTALALQCAMCYQTAAGQGAKGMQALNLGILILLLPPMAIIGCITWVVYQRREAVAPLPDGRGSVQPADSTEPRA